MRQFLWIVWCLLSPLALANLTESVEEVAAHRSNFGLDIQVGGALLPNYALTDSIEANQRIGVPQVGIEWLPIQSIGKLGLGLGYRLYLNQNVPVPVAGVPVTVFTSLVTHSLATFLSYHFDYVSEQVAVPFVRAGILFNWFSQTSRTDPALERPLRRADSLGLTAGLQIFLNHLDRTTAIKLRESVGIEATYLLLAFEKSTPLYREDAGTEWEAYQAGLRFEF